MPSDTDSAILITIPLSHYCEKARWALDRVALPYREQPHAPLLHLLATKRNHGGTAGRFALRLFSQERGCSSGAC